MNDLAIVLLGVAIVLFVVTIQFWRCAYENGRLEELVKQKEAEIKQLKRVMKDSD